MLAMKQSPYYSEKDYQTLAESTEQIKFLGGHVGQPSFIAVNALIPLRQYRAAWVKHHRWTRVSELGHRHSAKILIETVSAIKNLDQMIKQALRQERIKLTIYKT